MSEHDYSNFSIVDLAGRVATHLAHHDIQVVLVGGLAVEIYTLNRYLTGDIDMVNTSINSPAALKKAMAEIGFQKQGRVFENPTTNITVEFPSAPLAVGDEHIKEVTTCETAWGDIAILQAVDVVKDRLLAYLYWNDNQSAVQAITVALIHAISPIVLETFFVYQGETQKGKVVLDTLTEAATLPEPDMGAIEALFIKQLLAQRR